MHVFNIGQSILKQVFISSLVHLIYHFHNNHLKSIIGQQPKYETTLRIVNRSLNVTQMINLIYFMTFVGFDFGLELSFLV